MGYRDIQGFFKNDKIPKIQKCDVSLSMNWHKCENTMIRSSVAVYLPLRNI